MIKTKEQLNLKIKNARLLTKYELVEHEEQLPEIDMGSPWWLDDEDDYGDIAYAEGNYTDDDMYCSNNEANTWLRVALDIEGDIYVKCSIDVSSGNTAEIVQEIKDSIVNKISAYTNGQDVTATSLYSNIYVDGVTDVTSLTISSDGETYSTSAISIANNQVARTTDALIEVTINE